MAEDDMAVERARAAARVDRFDAAADRDLARAADARRLAAAIFRRARVVSGRHDASVGLHTPEVWMSRAAASSREELRRGVGFHLWLAGESLEETRHLLEREADRLDASASSYRRQAVAAFDELQATRSVSSTSPRG